MAAAVLMRARAALRQRWVAWVVLALLSGLGFGAATAAAIGARRTDSAYPRFIEAAGTFDVSTGGATGSEEEFVEGLERLKRLPQVERWAVSYSPVADVVTPTGRQLRFPELGLSVQPPDAAEASGVRVKLLRGRRADPNRPDEATISFAAEQDDLTVGRTITLLLPDQRKNPDAPEIVRARVRIVGVHAAPGEFQSVNGIAFPSLILSPAFYPVHKDVIHGTEPSTTTGLDLWLERGGDDVPALRDEAGRRGIQVELPVDLAEHVRGVQKTMRLEGWTLWALAAMLLVVTAAVAGPLIAREAFLDPTDNMTLRSLGMSRGALLAVALVRVAFVATGAIAVTLLAGTLGSALTPIGLARIAEIDPGIRLDGWALALGAVTASMFVILVSAVPAWRAAGAGTTAAGPRRPAAVPAALDRLAFPTTIALGARLALEPGAGRTAVPVRSTLLGIAASVSAVAMALTFVASLDDVLDTPRLSGFAWDVLVAGDTGALNDELRHDRDVEGYTRGGAVAVTVNGARSLAITVEADGAVQPVISGGRAPRQGEVALGRRTMRQLGVSVGDRVRVALANEGEDPAQARAVELEVVGQAIVPVLFFEAHEPGEGAVVTFEDVVALDPEARENAAFLVRLGPGVDLDRKVRSFADHAFAVARTRPGDVATLSRVSEVPVALASLLAALASAALVQTLVTTIRRRRRDLAILATMGLTRPQLRRVVVFQGTTLALAGLLVGAPVGLAAGRWAWRVFADEIGVLSRPATPLLVVVALVAGMLSLAAVVALLPAHMAARARPAVVLRAE
jgi:hypothetical protein